jgi:hypothetical protein
VFDGGFSFSGFMLLGGNNILEGNHHPSYDCLHLLAPGEKGKLQLFH